MVLRRSVRFRHTRYYEPMELLALIVLFVGIWALRKVLKKPTEEAQHPARLQDRPSRRQTSGEARIQAGATSITGDQCWVPVDRDATVAGYQVGQGMLYVGTGLKSVSEVRVEPALIDPSLRVNRSKPDRQGTTMSYWPSYGSITPEARAAYLEWLAGGRQDPNAYIGYVFLYFYGLERRALSDAPRSPAAQRDVPAIAAEVERLLRIYGTNNSFHGYASRFLDVLGVLGTDGSGEPPPLTRTSYEVPVSVRFGIGRLIAAGKPIPADWALSWYLTHPETSVRTPMQRCEREFRELFAIRYAREYGDGLLVKPNRSKLKFAITPASASFGGQIEVATDLPDIAAANAPIAKLRQLGEGCAADLDAFSRWSGRNSSAPKTLAAVALLPGELAASHQSEEARGLWEFVRDTVADNDMAVCQTTDLLHRCKSFGEGKLAKSEGVLLAQLLEKGGYGIEPDVRFAGAPLAPGGRAILFKLAEGASSLASPQYAAATVVLHLAVAISAADESISPAEEQHLHQHVQRGLELNPGERLRLSAHLAWLMQSPPSLSGLRKRLEPLDQRQRAVIADFIISVAGADGQISVEEIRTLGKIYPMLGLPPDDVYSHVHALTSGVSEMVAAAEPVTVIPAQTSTGFAIPAAPRPMQPVRLDMAAVNAKLAQAAQISAILSDIFTEQETPSTAPPAVQRADGPLAPSYAALLSRLVEQPEWSRSDFEKLANERNLLPDAVIDALNEAAFEHVGGPVLEGDDPIQIDLGAAKGLL